MDPNEQGQDAMSEPASGVELRCVAPRRVVDLIDAISIARRQTRTQTVVSILLEWGDLKHREITIAGRITARNPLNAGGDGSDSEFAALSAE